MTMIKIRDFKVADFSRVHAIYQAGIATGDATFETQAKDWDNWNDSAVEAARLVAVQDELVVGWACLAKVTNRCVYQGVAEVSVYVDPDFHGQGAGGQLLSRLILASEAAGYWTLQARIFPENLASIALHLKLGFQQLGTHERLGQLHGVWRDVVLLERRSTVVG